MNISVYMYVIFLYLKGVQLLLRNYDLDNKKHPAFSEEDVINIFPVVKHVEPQVGALRI